MESHQNVKKLFFGFNKTETDSAIDVFRVTMKRSQNHEIVSVSACKTITKCVAHACCLYNETVIMRTMFIGRNICYKTTETFVFD